MNDYGIDYDGPVPLDLESVNAVHVPETTNTLSSETKKQLQEIIDRESDNTGIDLFEDVVEYLSELN